MPAFHFESLASFDRSSVRLAFTVLVQRWSPSFHNSNASAPNGASAGAGRSLSLLEQSRSSRPPMDACSGAGGASRHIVGLLTPALLLCQKRSHGVAPILASGVDDFHQCPASRCVAGATLLEVVQPGRDRRARPGTCSVYLSDSPGRLADRRKSDDRQAPRGRAVGAGVVSVFMRNRKCPRGGNNGRAVDGAARRGARLARGGADPRAGPHPDCCCAGMRGRGFTAACLRQGAAR
jgi:hypothetical protein